MFPHFQALFKAKLAAIGVALWNEQMSAIWTMSTSPKMLKFSFKPYNCMDFVCSAFAKQAATSYCSVACMTLGGGMQQ